VGSNKQPQFIATETGVKTVVNETRKRQVISEDEVGCQEDEDGQGAGKDDKKKKKVATDFLAESSNFQREYIDILRIQNFTCCV